jgi:hypothetical protein
MQHLRIRALGKRERRVVVSHLQEMIDQTGWKVVKGESFVLESFDNDSKLTMYQEELSHEIMTCRTLIE